MGGFIPLSDASRRPRGVPIVTILIIVVNAFVFVLELAGGDAFVARWSVIPADIAAGHHWITILTAMFMHGGWLHIIGNMVFYLLGGVVAMLAQVAAAPQSTVPNLGASGAIAAVMGAFLITYPRDRIKSVLFIGWFGRITFIPAALLIGLWFVIQLFSAGGAAEKADASTGGVAYLAHIGGMIFGAVTARLFEHPERVGAES